MEYDPDLYNAAKISRLESASWQSMVPVPVDALVNYVDDPDSKTVVIDREPDTSLHFHPNAVTGHEDMYSLAGHISDEDGNLREAKVRFDRPSKVSILIGRILRLREPRAIIHIRENK